jgi:hypothetical protein
MGIKMGLLTRQIPMDELIDRIFIPKVIVPAELDSAIVQMGKPSKN